MADLTIPNGPEELSPEWLTAALRSGGALKNATVDSFDAQAIGEGTGLLGQLTRLALHYDRPEDEAPASLVVKVPAAAEENRQTGVRFRFYERENRFYEQIADEVQISTPRCFYSAMDPGAEQHVLLLEDLTDARMGDQLEGSSRQEAELVVREVARMHAGWWETPRLAELDWIPFSSDSIVTEPVDSSYRDAWEPFLRLFGDKLSPEVVHIGERLGSTVVRVLEDMAGPPRTLLHGDYRLDNMFFGARGGGSFTVIDWQICVRGRATFDVGYFMSQSLPPEQRRAAEMDILRMYHDILADSGINGYSFDQCLEDYRRTVLFCLVYPVISGGTYDLSEPRAMELVGSMLDRCVSAIVDLNAGELLPA